jgi:hypothetical protein
MKINESRVNELERIKAQFLELLNDPNLKSHWLKRTEVGPALYKTFCQKYGYDDEVFSKRYPELFNNNGSGYYMFDDGIFNKWFKEWREYQVIEKGWRYNPKFPYRESMKYLKSFESFSS